MEEAGKYLRTLTTEQASERMKSNYNYEHPFVLWHGGLHGRNIIVSHTSPRRILAVLDWDFGGFHALPFTD